MIITKKQASYLGKYFHINYKIIPFNEWLNGLNIELKHGSKFGKISNVSKNDLFITSKIVIAHLLEDPRYYYFLKKMEEKREKYWKNKTKPNIFISF